MFPFLRIGGSDGSNNGLKSAILNCICPQCGAALSVAANQFRCQGRCGADWRPVWNRICQWDRSHSSHRVQQAGGVEVSLPL